jgi:hypothetical protein
MAQIVRGYHGTTLSNAQAISTGRFNSSAGPNEWLGNGIYFFEAARTMAWYYAKRAVKRQLDESRVADEPALIAADIDT